MSIISQNNVSKCLETYAHINHKQIYSSFEVFHLHVLQWKKEINCPYSNQTYNYMLISLKSASTSDTFKMSIDGNAKSGSKVQFPGQSCEFDMMGDLSEQETAYLALKNGYCDSIPEKDLDIFVYFEVNFRKDNQSYLYKGKEEEDNFNFTKYVVTIDEIDVVWLYINNKNTQADGIQWDTPFISILVMDYSPISTEQDIITVYGWKKQVM